MAITNHERVGKALILLRDGLAPFVDREFRNAFGENAQARARGIHGEDPLLAGKVLADWEVNALLLLMWNGWNDVFRTVLGHAERSLVSELREVRKNWAHQANFSGDDTYRALDSVERLLTSVSAPQADEVGRIKQELLRLRFEEQARLERRKVGGGGLESPVTGVLKPWREVVAPHPDVASGRYQQAEFAADLWQVHLGEGTDEYRVPAEFFRRTYLTESLKQLLLTGVHRLSGTGGDPVVQLQTNFGGGKTHSMLALYHLFSGTPPGGLPGVDAILGEAGVTGLPKVRRVVLVGNKISPGNPVLKPDGTLVRTLWGELAWQLGGAEAYGRIQPDDERATSPGDRLRELMNDYGPCLVLVDEWVAYARQLHDAGDLPGGDFATHFSFAQALTESARTARQCLLVISLPASDTTGSPHATADNVEVGGLRGRDALERLRNAVGRVEASWRPATAEEGFEIVRRRLFQPLQERDQYVARDNVARAFSDMYRDQPAEFPPECRDAGYEKRVRDAYPIHPEIFDRLYTDWSTLVKFQRTRGVLRLMAAVIHCLWERGDRNPLILPALVPIDDPRVQSELTRYLSDNWAPILEKDVDGPNALPLRMDGEVPALGKYHACRRVARTIYLGSAPITAAANRGLEDRRVKLGCAIPGESTAVFGDALRRLSTVATYLYQDGARYWFDIQPTVTKLAEDRAEQLRRNPDKVAQEIDRRVRAALASTGDFKRVHPLPHSGVDVPDDLEARLVVLRIEFPYDRTADCKAEAAAREILEKRGNAPRLCRNSLVFLAADQARLQDLDEAVRAWLAWDSILAEKDTLNLTPFQVRQAEGQRTSTDHTVTARLPETYQWLIVPVQAAPTAPMEWQAYRLTGSEPLAVRAAKKLRNEDFFFTSMAGTRLRMELDKVPLWRGNDVSVRQLAEDFARYTYLPRLADPSVLFRAVADGAKLLLWYSESFAFADSLDPTAGRYLGLRGGQQLEINPESGLLVKPEVARRQLEAEIRPVPATTAGAEGVGGWAPAPAPPVRERPGLEGEPEPTKPAARRPRRFHATVGLNSLRLGSDAGRIGEEIVSHLTGLMGATVKVTLEIEAVVLEGAPENVVRTVTENCRTLKFTSHGFEED